jgi:hypothetical protein
MQEVETSLRNDISSGEEPDDFDLRCRIKRRSLQSKRKYSSVFQGLADQNTKLEALHLLLYDGELLKRLIITKGNKQKRQSHLALPWFGHLIF